MNAYAPHSLVAGEKTPAPKKDSKKAGRFNAVTVIKLHDFLKSSLLQSGQKFAYKSGMSDAKVAKILGVSEISVARHRKQLFGELVRPKVYKTEAKTKLVKRVASLEARIEFLEKSLGLK